MISFPTSNGRIRSEEIDKEAMNEEGPPVGQKYVG